MAISWYFVRFPGFFQEIAPQAFPSVTSAVGLAMTVVVGRWCGFAGVHTANQPLLPAPSVSKLTAPPRLRAGEPWVRHLAFTSLRRSKLRLTGIFDRILNVFY